MALIVQKFGGTSVADTEHIRAVAERVKAAVDAGDQVVVTVSAMAGTTDQLLGWTREVARRPDPEQQDVVVAAGEQMTAGLLALALQDLGLKSRAWLGWQIPLLTDAAFTKARIESIPPERLLAAIAGGEVPVVAGFQGVTPENRLTTLGRGGSDTSAVALAAALGAARCDIYTDVEGVFTADPRIVAKARKLDKITYEEMMEMASLGAKVLQTRSVALAMSQGVRIQVLSSFSTASGTLVVGEEEIVERQLVSGITYNRDEAKVTLIAVKDRPGVAATVFGSLAEAGINVDMIVQNSSADGSTADITFTVPKDDLERTVAVMEEAREAIGYRTVLPQSGVAKVSVIGVGMRSHAGVAHTMFQALSERNINIEAISTSEIKVSVLIDQDYTELAVRALHTAYGLDGD